jgi:hypothetical protein
MLHVFLCRAISSRGEYSLTLLIWESLLINTSHTLTYALHKHGALLFLFRSTEFGSKQYKTLKDFVLRVCPVGAHGFEPRTLCL